MAKSLDFAKLTLQDALDVAIIIEEEARDRYDELAEQLLQHNTPDAAKFFRTMVTNEEKHAEQLRAQRAKAFGKAPVTVERSLIPEVEITDYSEARAFMSAQKAYRIAYANETRAHDFYAAALKQTHEPAVQALFKELLDEEKEHQAIVKRALDKLPAETPGDNDDYVDEPNPQ